MNLTEIVEEVKNAQKNYLSIGISIKEVIKRVNEYLLSNIDLISKAYEIDRHAILLIDKFKKQLEIDSQYKSEIFKNEYGKVANMYAPYGVLGVISNCDTYIILRLIMLAIATKNGLIINITNNVGSNYLLINDVNKVLTDLGIGNLIGLYNNKEGENLEENENMDGIIFIGKKADAERVKVSSVKPVIYSGCGNYELYIEDNMDNNLISELKKISNMKIYSAQGIGAGQEVSGLEEAIARINETGNEFAVGIIAESRESIATFMNKIKARNVFVNASPTLMDDKLDIETSNLVYKRSILIYE